MRRSELIQLIEQNEIEDKQICFVTENGNDTFYACYFEDNKINIVLDSGEDKKHTEKKTFPNINFSELKSHLNCFTNNLEIWAYSLNSYAEYVLTGELYNEDGECCIYIRPDHD